MYLLGLDPGLVLASRANASPMREVRFTRTAVWQCEFYPA